MSFNISHRHSISELSQDLTSWLCLVTTWIVLPQHSVVSFFGAKFRMQCKLLLWYSWICGYRISYRLQPFLVPTWILGNSSMNCNLFPCPLDYNKERKMKNLCKFMVTDPLIIILVSRPSLSEALFNNLRQGRFEHANTFMKLGDNHNQFIDKKIGSRVNHSKVTSNRSVSTNMKGRLNWVCSVWKCRLMQRKSKPSGRNSIIWGGNSRKRLQTID